MSETNDSGNRWENPAEAAPSAEATAPEPAGHAAIDAPAAVAADGAAAPVAEERGSRLPRWVTRAGLLTTGAAAAIFLGGAGVGFAIGASHDDGKATQHGRFDRGFDGPGGQLPGNGQLPGGGPGQNFGGPDQQQAPQGQSQGNGSGSSSGSGVTS